MTRSDWVTIPHGDLAIDAYYARPEGDGPFPGVIVIQEIFGVNPHIRAVTERLAAAGFAAIAPNIYQRTAPGLELGYNAADTALGREHKDATTAPQLLGDLQATIDWLQARPEVKRGPVGSIGFCFGGHVVYLGATLPGIGATASYYGGGIATFCPGGGPATIHRTPDIHGTVYAYFGTRDPLIPNEQIDAIEAALTAASPRHRVFRYPVGHGFNCDARPDYDTHAAADAWAHTLELFRRVL